jgi:PIN domain nuclease of toxin-antitoxin system
MPRPIRLAAAARGERFVTARAGKPLVKVRPVDGGHAAAGLPMTPADPFDRLMATQAAAP